MIETSTGSFLDFLSGGASFLSGELTLGRTCVLVSHFGTVDGDGFVGVSVSAVVSGSARVGDISQSDSSDLRFVAASDAVSADAFVDDGVVVAYDIIVDDGRIVVDLFCSIATDSVIVTVVLTSAEVASIDEGVVAVTQPESEADTDS